MRSVGFEDGTTRFWGTHDNRIGILELNAANPHPFPKTAKAFGSPVATRNH